MSRREIVLLASRTLSLLLMCWILVEFTYLPERISTYTHHLTIRSVMTTTDYLGRYYLLAIGMIALRILVLSCVAVFLWRCGPGVETLLAPERGDEPLSR